MNEYTWHESLRRLARGVSSLHQHQNTGRKKEKKKGRELKRGGKGREKKRGEGRQTHTLDKDN